jgi:hypothetical protein
MTSLYRSNSGTVLATVSAHFEMEVTHHHHHHYVLRVLRAVN